MTTQAVIALGANLGERAATLAAAAQELGNLPGTTLRALSSLYESAAVKPYGVDPSAPEYLNAVALVETDLSPEQLLQELAALELRFGRVRDERWGDRTLDLDIITYGQVQQADSHLTLPHPRAHERSFVLVPWLELDPLAELPRGTVADLAADLAHEVRPFEAKAVN
jgi:2-amino-4-hydroxy-6-hydroxymethyldihydropteridine diphosphokinase